MSDGLIIKKVKCGDVLNVTYEEYNSAIEAYEEKGYKGKEAPVPDLRESLNVLASQVMQEMSFVSNKKNEAWSEFKIKSVTFDGLTVGAVIIFDHSTEGPIEVKCPSTNSVTAEVVEGCLEELKDYVTGKKRAQGDLFKTPVEQETVDSDQEPVTA